MISSESFVKEVLNIWELIALARAQFHFMIHFDYPSDALSLAVSRRETTAYSLLRRIALHTSKI